jgi:tRNA 2-thiouridine synthesizing protein A
MAMEYLDTCGLKCPQPILKVAVKSPDMKPGDILEVTGDCPSFERDMRLWSERLKRTILSVKQDGQYKKTIQIQF